MPHVNIPGTSLRVSRICLGTMTFGTPVCEADAVAITHWALDHGINFIDTANMYEGYTRYVGSSGGVSEEILGVALQGRRDQAVLATKVGMKIGPADDDQGLSRSHVLREIERSLTRLQTDYVDLYYMHKPDPDTPLAESVETFSSLQDTGKIRTWGLSNFSAEQIRAVLTLCDQNSWHRPTVLQPPYSMLKRDVEADVLPLCARERIAVVPYQVLQGGVLTGKYHRGQQVPADSRQQEKPEWTLPLTDDLFDQLEELDRQAAAADLSLMHYALKMLLEQPAVLSLILGVKRTAQLQAVLPLL